MEYLLDIEEYVKLVVGMIILVDPIGAIPVFLGISSGELASQRVKIVLISMLTFVLVLLIFLFAGDYLFSHFGLSVDAFRVAGGLLILKMGYDMMKDEHGGNTRSINDSSAVRVALVPLAIPLFAGPGTITLTIIYGSSHQSPEHNVLVSLVIVSVAVLTGLILAFSAKLEHIIGPTGMHIINQLMAIIVMVIGVEFILDGIAAHFGIEILGGALRS